jgi:hypothetical protein
MTLSGSHSGNSFEFSHRLTDFLNYALFCQKLPEIINLTRFLKSFWMLYIDQIIVYNAFYSKLTFYIIKDRCQMHTLKVFRSPVWLLVKLIISGSFSVEITISGYHSGNSFEFSHRLTDFLNYALFCLSFCLCLNLKPKLSKSV